MKTMIIVAAIGMMSTNAMAMSAYNSKSMSCATVHEKMAQEGSIVLRYPSHHPGMMMYNRTVSNSMACLGQGAMASASVPTSDDPNCKIKTCSFGTGKGPNKNH
ncbi:hypothetical protein HGP17_12360 [Rhizobium sp. P38BS-XIX]|uniref:hypothetical protein n=1 Tax=Rhizobium sp. P38BS-XIX TaxID=2726740 RepID=UPI001456F6DA|nr:hypothetical protein [Rhizobium sp. P38BS-XIX]NLR97603.1 hypothetical protein [Rhizobium sp. P38BS-XIX]